MSRLNLVTLVLGWSFTLGLYVGALTSLGGVSWM